MKVNSASCWFFLYGYITMHGQQNVKCVMGIQRAIIRLKRHQRKCVSYNILPILHCPCIRLRPQIIVP